jgi:diguanylate cyclase (GGDEF)-like protein/PAS domain S-box-containing protein
MSKGNIFIVEDESIVALDIAVSLNKLGYFVAGKADRGEVAIQKAGELCPDLVLMDIRLKGQMDGIEAAEYIRARFNIPIIFLSAHADSATLQRARVTEPYAYIVKPFEDRELDTNISIALYKHAMERQLRENELKYRSLFESMAQGVLYQDAQGRVTSANPAAERILGLTFDQMAGNTPSDPRWRLIHEGGADFSAETLPAMVALQTGQEVKNVVAGVRNPEKESLTWIRAHAVPQFREGESTPYQVFATFEDITAIKNAEAALRASEKHYRTLVETSPDAITLTDVKGNFLSANQQSLKLHGFDNFEELRDGGRNGLNLITPQDEERAKENVQKACARGPCHDLEYTGVRKDGSTFPLEVSFAAITDEEGKPAAFVSISRDITARKELEQAERDQRQLAEALRDTAMILSSSLKLDDVLDRILSNIGGLVQYDAALVLLIEKDAVRRIRYKANPQGGASRISIGDMQANLLNTPILRTLIQTKQSYLIPDIQQDKRWQVVPIPGMQRIRSLICAPINIQGNVAGVINVISAAPNFFSPLHMERIMMFAGQAAVAIENAQLYEQAKRLSMTDSLTGLFNMRYFIDFAVLEWERVRRYSRTLSVAMLDIDRFKNVNDTYGHDMGDHVLREIAQRIKNAVRNVDVVARYGGEEFVLLMPETEIELARQVAERIRAAIGETPITSDGPAIPVTVSLGVAETNEKVKDFNTLLKNADQALYAAKSAGRNQVIVWQAGE